MVLVIGVLLAGGCSSGRGGSIVLQSRQKGEFTESFANAFFMNVKGEYDILLVDNDSAWRFKKSSAKKVINPMEITPVRQAMLIHTNWSHKIGATANPSSINAAVTWYVLGESSQEDMMVYQGVAHVVVHGDPDDPDCTIRIKEGEIAPAMISGKISDPIGPALITGYCRAIRNESQLKDILAEMRERKSQAEKAAGPEGGGAP
jgi:hypothetical protein